MREGTVETEISCPLPTAVQSDQVESGVAVRMAALYLCSAESGEQIPG